MLHKCDFGPRTSQRLDIGQKCTRGLTVLVFYYVNRINILYLWMFCFLPVLVISVLAISLFSFFLILSGSLMSIFWKEWRSTENKYSLIECWIATFSLQCFHVDLCTHSHTVSFTPVSLKSNPRLLQYNRYHLTYMGRDVFLSFPLTLVPSLSLSYKSSFSPSYPSQSSLLFHGLMAGCQPVRKMRLQSIRASQGGLWPQDPTP